MNDAVMINLSSRIKILTTYCIASSLLAASTLAYAQDVNAPQPDVKQQQTAGNGWPQAPDANTGNSNPGNGAQVNNGAPNPYGQPPYQQSQYPQLPQYPQQQSYPQAAPQAVPAQLTVPAGTYITTRLDNRLASDKNHQGDGFTATLTDPVVVNGVVVAEPGQTITGQVIESQKVDGAGRLAIQLTDLPLVDGQRLGIQTQLIARRANRFQGRDVGTVAGTTALGAAIGGAVGWGTGAAIGAGAGALISLGAVMTHGHASVLYPEELLTFRLAQPISITTTAAPQAFHYVQPGEYGQAPYQGHGPTTTYAAAAPPPAYYGNGYPYYGYGYGYGYPYWGPSVGFYFGSRGYYGRSYGAGFYSGGHYGGGHFSGGGSHGRR